MNRSALVSIVAIAFSGVSAAADNMIGEWQCLMVSDYGDFEFVLTLNDDKTYSNKQDMFGSVSIGTGKWSIDGSELVMNRETYSKNGEEKASAQEFRREVISVSGSELKLKHDDIITTCSRS